MSISGRCFFIMSGGGSYFGENGRLLGVQATDGDLSTSNNTNRENIRHYYIH